MFQTNDIALFGAGLAGLVAWQARHTIHRGGSFYDREVYGITMAVHKRIGFVALVVALSCIIVGIAVPTLPVTPFVAVETVCVILYLASFARGASYEDEI